MNSAINGTLIWDINIQSGRTYFAYKCTISDPSLKEAGLICVKGKMVLYGGGDNKICESIVCMFGKPAAFWTKGYIFAAHHLPFLK